MTQPPPPRRFLRSILAGVAMLILLPVAAGAIFIATFDADAYKPRIVAAVKQATGRELTIQGPIGVKLSLVPTLRIEDAALSNPPGFSRPEMVRLHRLDLQLALLPLLSRRVEVVRLVLTDPDILLETNAADQPNWLFPRPVASPAAGNEAKNPQPGPDVASPDILVRRIEVDGGQLAFRDPHGVTRTLVLRKLALSADGASASTTLDGTVEIAGTAITVKAIGGPLAALVTGAAARFPIDLTVAAQGATASLKGSVAMPAILSGSEFTLNASVPDLSALSTLAGAALPALHDATLQTQVEIVLPGVVLHGLKVTIPQADLNGDGTLTLTPRLAIQGKLHATKIDLDALNVALSSSGSAPLPGVFAQPAGSPSLVPAMAEAPKSQKIFSDGEFSLGALLAFDADVDLSVEQWFQGGVTLRDFAGHALLRAGQLRLDPFAVTVPGGAVQFRLAVDASLDPPPVSLWLHAPALLLPPMLTAMHLPEYAQGQVELMADLRGAGRSPHAIVAGLDGNLGLASENGQFDPGLLAELLRQKDLIRLGGGLTALRCLALRTDVSRGVVDIRTWLLDTAPLRLTGTGSVHLDSETLALRLLTTVRLGGAGVFAPMEVGGTLRSPTVQVGKIDAIGGAAAALAKGSPQFGMVIGRLGLDRLIPGTVAEDETCEHALAVARGVTPPASVGPAVNSPPAPTFGTKPPKPLDLLRQLLR